MLLIGAMLGGASLAGDAQAADRKVFHGGICQWDENQPPDLTYEALGVANNGSTSVDLVCPLVRDNIFANDNIVGVWVEMTKSEATTTTCRLKTQREDSDDMHYFDYETETATGPGAQQMVFRSVQTFNGDESSYSLECDLDPGDKLTQITVKEQN